MPVGFYGKLPSHGDFLQRGVNDEFVNRWDAWLQDGIARSRSELGEAWLDVFLTSPLWRFAFASGVVGGPAWAGVLLPSVDRVGRYFPLTIVAELTPGVLPFELAVTGNGWFDWAETLARRMLEDELVDLDRLESDLLESDALLASVRAPDTRLELGPLGAPDAAAGWFPLAQDGDMGRFSARVANGLAASVREPLALWWSVGSEHVAPSVLLTRGLPPPSAFRELLCGAMQKATLLADPIAAMPPTDPIDSLLAMPLTAPVDPVVAVPLALPAEPIAAMLPALLTDPIVAMPLTLPPATPHQHSAAISEVGRVRDENQDAFVERADDGLWLVADGMGGHQGGKLASQLVAERVKSVAVTGDVAAVARDVSAAIIAVNTELRSRGEVEPGFDGGSTVVALCVQGEEGIALWAGDSRLYRLRGGELEQLTRDHSVSEEDGPAAIDAHMLTRAVGGADLLALEELRLDVRPDDRLLLCSDGLYGDLTTKEIAERLAAPDCAEATQSLVALALERGGTDNATAVVIAVDGSEISAAS
ncbi:MAG: type VI secretion system-associated protein TagF [Steroidobacteraceae bacterium]